jgi:ceramide glucosyltransferase
VDAGASENFASLCRQDYPNYAVLFCVGGPHDPVVPLLDRLRRDHPECAVRVLFGAEPETVNDKAGKLVSASGERGSARNRSNQ